MYICIMWVLLNFIGKGSKVNVNIGNNIYNKVIFRKMFLGFWGNDVLIDNLGF